MPHRLRWSWFFEQLHFCSPDRRKISSLYGLWLVRYDPILEVMSGRIYSKFDIAPKAELWSKPLKLSVSNTGIGLYKLYISDFHIVDLRSDQFGDLPIVSDWAKNQVPKYLTHLFNSLRMMMNYLTRAWPWGEGRITPPPPGQLPNQWPQRDGRGGVGKVSARRF